MGLSSWSVREAVPGGDAVRRRGRVGYPPGVSGRIQVLAQHAPDVVAAWRGIKEGRLITVRREVRRRSGPGSAARVVPQLAAVASLFAEIVEGLPDAAFAMPGGEGEWNVAQAIGHAADSRAGLAMAASLAASGHWPATAPTVIPGRPGRADATREQLVRRLATSQRIVERAARAVEGHEVEACPLDHPLVGRLRCGEWLLFAGVHDLMHVEQLERLEAFLASGVMP
jgi:hypothetical protein